MVLPFGGSHVPPQKRAYTLLAINSRIALTCISTRRALGLADDCGGIGGGMDMSAEDDATAAAMPRMVRDNPALNRYELQLGDVTAFVTYIREPGRITLIHTEVPKELGGRGVGTALAAGVLADIRSRGEKVIAKCPFIAAFIRSHKEFQDLLADPASLDHGDLT
jgi:uncharacterized protein